MKIWQKSAHVFFLIVFLLSTEANTQESHDSGREAADSRAKNSPHGILPSTSNVDFLLQNSLASHYLNNDLHSLDGMCGILLDGTLVCDLDFMN